MKNLSQWPRLREVRQSCRLITTCLMMLIAISLWYTTCVVMRRGRRAHEGLHFIYCHCCCWFGSLTLTFPRGNLRFMARKFSVSWLLGCVIRQSKERIVEEPFFFFFVLFFNLPTSCMNGNPPILCTAQCVITTFCQENSNLMSLTLIKGGSREKKGSYRISKPRERTRSGLCWKKEQTSHMEMTGLKTEEEKSNKKAKGQGCWHVCLQ